MLLSTEEICRFADTNPKKNNYREAERILKTTDNLFSCGKDKQKEGETFVKITARCIATSGVRSKEPHLISGNINILSNGQCEIESMIYIII